MPDRGVRKHIGAYRYLDESVPVEHHGRESMSRCIGVSARRCGKESDPRSKRCSECRTAHKKLKKRQHNGNYYQDHRDQLNAQRRIHRKIRREIIRLRQEIQELQESYAVHGLPPPRPPTARPAEGGQSKKAQRGRPPLTDEEKLDRKKRLGAGLYIRVKVEGKPPHQAWYETHPRSTASQENATREANRLIRWILKEDPIDIRTAIFLQGIDYDTYCQFIKELLSTTRYYRGKPTDLPDWDARREGLKLLMIGLGLATPIGFRSGPRAVGGALENEPIEMNGAGETGVHDPEEHLVRKLRAEAIIFRHVTERKRLSDCWKEVCPSSAENPRSAAKKAQADIDWYKARCFQTFEQRLVANGLDNHTVVEGIIEMLKARRVSRGVLIDDPDWPVRTKGRDLWMVLLGFRHPRGRRGRTPRVISMLDVGWPPAAREAV